MIKNFITRNLKNSIFQIIIVINLVFYIFLCHLDFKIKGTEKAVGLKSVVQIAVSEEMTKKEILVSTSQEQSDLLDENYPDYIEAIAEDNKTILEEKKDVEINNRKRGAKAKEIRRWRKLNKFHLRQSKRFHHLNYNVYQNVSVDFEVHFVISHCQEPYDWILKVIAPLCSQNNVSVHLYEKCGQSSGGEKIKLKLVDCYVNVVKLLNVGREGHTFLYHLLSHCHQLGDVNFFLQGGLESCPHELKYALTNMSTYMKQEETHPDTRETNFAFNPIISNAAVKYVLNLETSMVNYKNVPTKGYGHWKNLKHKDARSS